MSAAPATVRAGTAYHEAMNLLESLAGAFFRSFGITEPTDKARRGAAIFLLVMLIAVVVGLCGAAFVLFRVL